MQTARSGETPGSSERDWFWTPWLRAGLILMVVVPFAAFAFMAQLGAHPLDSRANDLDRIFTAAAVLALLPVAVLFWLRARQQRRGNLSVALGLATLALLGLGAQELVPLIAAGDSPVDFGSWRTLTLLVILLFLAPAVRLDTRIRRLPILIMTIGLAVMGLVSLVVESTGGDASLAVFVGWVILTAALAASYLRTAETTYLWLAIILLGFLMSELGRLQPSGSEGVWALAMGVARTVAILIALLGLVVDLDQSGSMRRLELERALQRNAVLTSFTDATLSTMHDRDHEARSALGAMEYTLQALKRRGADIDDAALAQLETSMSAEISLLRRLITIPDAAAAVRPFLVIDAVTGVVESARERGLTVDVDVPEDLMARGVLEATAQIVQSLLDNARKHAPGSPVTVRAIHAGSHVVLSVDDQGPGIPKTKHRQIFQRGRDGGHPTSVQGRGLGLYISARLATEQRGELWVVDASGGGASFRLALEAFPIMNAHQTEDDTEMLPRGVAAPPRLSTVRVRHAD